MSDKKNVWVVPHEKKWAIRFEGDADVSEVFKRQSEAYRKARSLAVEGKLELVVLGRNGQIRVKNSYGNDPRGSKG